jgi:hypothetical protein
MMLCSTRPVAGSHSQSPTWSWKVMASSGVLMWMW